MKLSIIALATVVAGKKLHPPSKQIEKMQKHINDVWTKWFGACKKDSQLTRYLALVTDVGASFANNHNQGQNCAYFDAAVPNGGPKPARKRRTTDEDSDDDYSDYFGDDEEGDEVEPRLSSSRPRAIKQLGKLISKFGERYMADCEPGAGVWTTRRINKRAIRRTKVLTCMSCGGGDGCVRPL